LEYPAGEGFSFTLPPFEDEEGDTFTFTVDIGAAIVFMKYNAGSFVVKDGATT
jgi:hypothetical protein